MLIYANHWTREELFWSKERQILTVTSTFAFNREMRWVWLWLIQFVSVMMLSNVRTVSRHFTFLCERFNVSHSWCYLLKTSFIVWPLSLSAIVIFIQGDAPRMNRVSNISPLIWTMHYVFVLMMGSKHSGPLEWQFPNTVGPLYGICNFVPGPGQSEVV